jgi:hypothetical protein
MLFSVSQTFELRLLRDQKRFSITAKPPRSFAPPCPRRTGCRIAILWFDCGPLLPFQTVRLFDFTEQGVGREVESLDQFAARIDGLGGFFARLPQ